MILSMSGQAVLFMSTVAVGYALGFVYDVFRIIRKTFAHPDFLTQIEDVLFWIFVTGVMCLFMLNKNYGEIRFFSIAGAALGMILYFYTLSIVVISVSVFAVNLIKKIVMTLINLILFPLKLAYNIVDKILLRPLKKILQNFTRYVKMRIHILLKGLGEAYARKIKKPIKPQAVGSRRSKKKESR